MTGVERVLDPVICSPISRSIFNLQDSHLYPLVNIRGHIVGFYSSGLLFKVITLSQIKGFSGGGSHISNIVLFTQVISLSFVCNVHPNTGCPITIVCMVDKLDKLP